MPIKYLNGKRLYYAFISGANKIIEQKEQLNRINVFPVPDGDTGTNLAATVNNMIQEVKASNNINTTLRSMANAALSGARGNSGIIFAQFFNGWAHAVGNQKTLNIQTFGESVKDAVPSVYQAILHPVEGTMLSVIKAWAQAVYDMKNKTSDFEEIFNTALEIAKKALDNTPTQLKILRDARVVDAGARGFVHLLEGMNHFIHHGNLKEIVQRQELAEGIVEPIPEEPFDLTYRYCTEALLSGFDVTRTGQLKKQLEKLGESIIVAGNEQKTRLHIHTNEPAELFSLLSSYGNIINPKVDDMKKQYTSAHKEHPPIALITDSIADIPEEILDKYNVHILPISIFFENKEFLDKITISPEIFHEMIEKSTIFPTSSQPSIKTAESVLLFLCSHYKSIIALMVSGKISGTWNSVYQASLNLQEKGCKITVVDSKLNSGAQGLLVQKTAELINSGLTHAEIVEKIYQLIPKTKIMVSVANFKYMVQSGRVSPFKGYLARVLNLKPIITLDEEGKGVAFAKAFSRKANFNKIINIIKENHQKNPVTRYCIVHSQAPILAEQYRKSLLKILQKEPQYIEEVSSVVAMASGKSAVAVCIMSE